MYQWFTSSWSQITKDLKSLFAQTSGRIDPRRRRNGRWPNYALAKRPWTVLASFPLCLKAAVTEKRTADFGVSCRLHDHDDGIFSKFSIFPLTFRIWLPAEHLGDLSPSTLYRLNLFTEANLYANAKFTSTHLLLSDAILSVLIITRPSPNSSSDVMYRMSRWASMVTWQWLWLGSCWLICSVSRFVIIWSTMKGICAAFWYWAPLVLFVFKCLRNRRRWSPPCNFREESMENISTAEIRWSFVEVKHDP